MARDPGSTWRPLPEAGPPDGHAKTQMIYHSTGSLAPASAIGNYFAQENVAVESTFIVGWGPHDPTLQIMDSTDRADANGSANQRAISVEVVGDGIGPYNEWQIAECVRLGRWARREHAIPPRVIPSEPAGGFGWHVMFGAPGPWTSVRGKICPGPRRIQQLQDTVFPAVFAGTPAPEEDDLTPQQAAQLDFVFKRIAGRDVQRWIKGGPELGGFVVLDQWEDGAWPARSADVGDVIGILRTVQSGDQRVLAEISSAFHQEADRDAANMASLTTQLAAIGNGDPAILAKALREALGPELAAEVAARLDPTTS
ncbi:peptidoglycan recognition protein family protein [Geodermatophilus ruber]|uniref:N-acetylmuramoyl-L-alanine amidase domain-containing protein n=1 Tax=Geodermatophilus ruber TaxID=504800 RepID=A0A1I4EUJ4_9ACTN|nr:N-acetylmuramoyl-L-alanine amidase [Geodermatophilus ruber]SFL08873.1 hypothetical protein SAMN04488085_106178 [Geodermatophilus ruber]